jgi:hypothetical protein
MLFVFFKSQPIYSMQISILPLISLSNIDVFYFSGFSIKALMFDECFLDVKELGGKT